MQDCIFCKIVKGEIPSSKLYENEKAFVFLDIDPVNTGHSLVIPKEHFVHIYETPDDVLADMMKAVKEVSQAIKKSLNVDGINVLMNNDPAAGQIVFHAHIHVIPRLHDDGFHHWRGNKKYQEGEREEVAKKIIQAL